jgi:hypothetical protein
MKILILLFVLGAGSGLAQQLPPAPRAHLTDITPAPGYFNEPAVAINSKDLQQAGVAW